MKTIGLDIDLDTCRGEGYLMMTYDEEAFLKDPRGTYCDLFATCGCLIAEEIGLDIDSDDVLTIGASENFEGLMETYLEHLGEACEDVTHEDSSSPGPYEVLHLAETINQMGRLDTVGVTLDLLKWRKEVSDNAEP